jgi:predicted dehydrogenase
VNVSDIAVIGCGRIAWKLEQDPLRYKPCTHLGAIRNWQKKKRLRISSLCDTDVANAQGAAAFLGARDAKISGDYREAIAAKPDLLVIAASTTAHFEILAAALDAGIPRIVMEKPVAFSIAEARQLRKKITRSRSVVLPNYERRYHPKYLRLKAKVAEARSYRGFFATGTGGTVARNGQDALRVASACGKSLYADRKQSDEGVLLHDTTHLLDLAQFFFGEIHRRRVVCGERRHLLYLEHQNGASGVIETALGVGAFHLELEIHTPQERIRVGNGFLESEKIRPSPHYKGLASYSSAQRLADAKFPISQNPFVKLYESALFGKPDNAHFLEALANAEILGTRRRRLFFL